MKTTNRPHGSARRRVGIVTAALAATALIVVGSGVAVAHPTTIAGTAVAAEQVNRDSVSSAQPAAPDVARRTAVSGPRSRTSRRTFLTPSAVRGSFPGT